MLVEEGFDGMGVEVVVCFFEECFGYCVYFVGVFVLMVESLDM